MQFQKVFKIALVGIVQSIALIGFLVGAVATYFSALGVYYKEPYFSVAETLLYAFITMLCLFASLKLFKGEKRAKV